MYLTAKALLGAKSLVELQRFEFCKLALPGGPCALVATPFGTVPRLPLVPLDGVVLGCCGCCCCCCVGDGEGAGDALLELGLSDINELVDWYNVERLPGVDDAEAKLTEAAEDAGRLNSSRGVGLELPLV